MVGFVTEEILWPPLYSLPSKCQLPLILRSVHSMPTDLWPMLGGCQHGRLWAGRQPEKPHQSKDSPHSPPENHSQALLTQEDPAQPQCSAELLSHPLCEQLGAGIRDTPLSWWFWFLCGLSAVWCLPAWHWPAFSLAGHQHQMWRRAEEHCPTSQPHTGSLSFSRVVALQGHCHHCHCTPVHLQAGDAAAELAAFSIGMKLRTVCRQRTLLQPPGPHAMTTVTLAGVATSGMGRQWSCSFMAQLTLSPSFPPLQGRAITKISLGVMWLFWLFFILDVLWEESAKCNAQSIHAFTSILYELME